MSTHIPIDIAREIQSFLKGNDQLLSRLICKEFHNEPDVNLVYEYKNGKYPLPNWVTKVKVGREMKDRQIMFQTQLVYLDVCGTDISYYALEFLDNLKYFRSNIRIGRLLLDMPNPTITHLCLTHTYLKFLTGMKGNHVVTHLVIDSQKMLHSMEQLSVFKNLKSLTLGNKLNGAGNFDTFSLEYLDCIKTNTLTIDKIRKQPLKHLRFDNSCHKVGTLYMPTLEKLHLKVREFNLQVTGHPNLVITFEK